ncbi:MAG: hypothetical protein C0603_12935 [Denitrovibrio sp.]|nr:MAG: hypothetical protein C0603_12935 [Denitrovibrio sp.]
MENEKEILISQFIDDELEIDEKIELVKEIRQTDSFAEQTIEMLEQEKAIASIYNLDAPQVPEAVRAAKVSRLTFANVASMTALAASLILIVKVFFVSAPVSVASSEIHRFVLHMPEAENISIAGSFSGWKNLEMQQVKGSGYWQIALPLAQGEHSYSFIVDGEKQIADPTVPARQMDDFGGENSIITVSNRI